MLNLVLSSVNWRACDSSCAQVLDRVTLVVLAAGQLFLDSHFAVVLSLSDLRARLHVLYRLEEALRLVIVRHFLRMREVKLQVCVVLRGFHSKNAAPDGLQRVSVRERPVTMEMPGGLMGLVSARRLQRYIHRLAQQWVSLLLAVAGFG